MSARWDEARLAAALARGGARRRLVLREEVPSTQDLAFTLAEHGAPDGSVVLADRQTRGRGRLGREWDSPAGAGVWFSVLLRPPPEPPPRPPLLVAATAVAVAGAVEAAAGLRAGLRWPNDLVAGDRKVAGILLETRDFDPRAPLLVLGVGINTARTAEEFPEEIRAAATSLLLETGRAPDPNDLLEACLAGIDRWLGRLAAGDAAAVEEAYAARAAGLGRRVRVLDGNEPVEGTLESVSPLAGLGVRLDDGSLRTLRPEHARELRPARGGGGRKD